MARYTQRLILTTFEDMLNEMPFEKITVSALVKRCDVSPNTFYYHYRDIYALLNVYLSSRFGDYLTEERIAREGWRATTKALLEDCRQCANIIYHIYDSISRDALERYVFSITDDVFYRQVKAAAERSGGSANDERLHEIAELCRYAFLGYFLKFLWSRMNDDIDKAIDSLGDLFTAFVTHAVNE